MSSCISILYNEEPSRAGPPLLLQTNYHAYAVLLEICCIIIYLWVLCLMWVMCTFRYYKVLGSKASAVNLAVVQEAREPAQGTAAVVLVAVHLDVADWFIIGIYI